MAPPTLFEKVKPRELRCGKSTFKNLPIFPVVEIHITKKLLLLLPVKYVNRLGKWGFWTNYQFNIKEVRYWLAAIRRLWRVKITLSNSATICWFQKSFEKSFPRILEVLIRCATHRGGGGGEELKCIWESGIGTCLNLTWSCYTWKPIN